ncbi:hypothetical protein ACOMHN_043824 [Nucella lapillus]
MYVVLSAGAIDTTSCVVSSRRLSTQRLQSSQKQTTTRQSHRQISYTYQTKMAAKTCWAFVVMLMMVTAAVLLGDVLGLPQEYPNLQERCQGDRTAIFAHPWQCQLYYNCSHDAVPDPRSYLHQYLQECPYPQLFSNLTLRCEPFDQVTCGDRVEHVDLCDYLSSKCGGPHCRPCWINPSCKGLPDGKNSHRWREWSPYYIVCRSNRKVGSAQCPVDDLNVPQYFHPELRRCVTDNEIPRNAKR